MIDVEKKTALITGGSGQDAILLSKLLHAQDWRVVVLSRSKSSELEGVDGIELIYVESYDKSLLRKWVEIYSPNALYHFAAKALGRDVHDVGRAALIANAQLPVDCLDVVKSCLPSCKVFLPISSEIYTKDNGICDERTLPKPASPYGAAKMYSWSLARYYREQFGIYVVCGILFNHESIYRKPGILSKDVAVAAAEIALGLRKNIQLRSLDDRKDWSSAEDFVLAMSLAMKYPTGDDYVFASGEHHSVRDFCEIAFSVLGLDYRNYVSETGDKARGWVVGNPNKLRSRFNWLPTRSFKAMVEEMVIFERRRLENEIEIQKHR